MKKGRLKKILCIGLALAMTVSLPACGKKKNDNTALAKEHVYKYQEVSFPDLGEDVSIWGTIRKDDTVYVLVRVYHWNDEKYNENYDGYNDVDVRLITMKDDGSDVRSVTLQIPTNNNNSSGISNGVAVPMPVGSVSMPMLRTAPSVNTTEDEPEANTESGSDTEDSSDTESGSSDSEGSVDGTIDIIDKFPGQNGNVWENSDYNNFVIGGDGGIYAIKHYYYSFDDYVNPENSTYIRKQYLSAWNSDGSIRRETELEGIETEENYYYISNYIVDAEGNASLLLSGDGVFMMTVDAQGKSSDKMELPEDVDKVFSNLDNMIDKGDGNFWVLYRDENDWQKVFIADYNMNTGVLGEAKELPSSFGWSNCIAAGINSDLIYSNQNGLYSLNGGDAESVMKMDYINSDMNIYGFQSVVELDENRFLGVFSESYDNTIHAGIFTHVDPEEIKDKKVLVLAGMRVDSDMKQRVVEFNRSSEEYRIVVKTYYDYNRYGEYNDGVTRLNNDIISGSMPDILVTTNLPSDNYAAKGLLADIRDLIDKDEELSGVEFMSNVFEAYSMNDKLYYVIPSFRANTMIAKKAVVGDRNTWTMKDVKEVMATLPESSQLISELTRDRFFDMAMQYCGSDFVDVAAGKCNFNSEGFIALMEFAKTLPEELGEEYWNNEDYWNNYESMYRDNRTVLCQMSIGSIRNMNYTINGSFGEPVSYIGFPTESGQGSSVQAINEYAISAKSKHKDVAWEFLRYYLVDDYQSKLTYGLPIQKKYFKEQAQEALQRPYWVNKDGEKEYYDDYFWMNGERIPLSPMSQEQIDEAVAMIESITKHPYENQELMNIINEDMGAFFSGQKSAQEVAETIQNRAQLYVDENS